MRKSIRARAKKRVLSDVGGGQPTLLSGYIGVGTTGADLSDHPPRTSLHAVNDASVTAISRSGLTSRCSKLANQVKVHHVVVTPTLASAMGNLASAGH